MHHQRSRFLCILLTAALLVSAIAGAVNPLFMKADALAQDVGFTAWNGYCYTAKATNTTQGMEAYKIAATQTTQTVADKVYNILFNATYRITDFGGTLWPIDNSGTWYKSMYDAGLGTTVNWNWGAMGCYSYALFVAQYLRGSNGRDNMKVIHTAGQSASVLEDAIRKYADPGELIYFTHASSVHAISYLASDADGFYFISDNGDSRDIRLYYATFSYFASKSINTVELFDTNNGKDVQNGTPTQPEPTEPEEPTIRPEPERPAEPEPPVEAPTESPTEPPTEGTPAPPEQGETPVIPPIDVPQSQAVRQYNGHTYILYTGADDYEEAKAFAEESGGYLATITTMDEQEIVSALLKNASCPFAWIGMENSFQGGNYAWTTGEEVIYKNFSSTPNTTKKMTGFVFTDKLSNGSLLGQWNTCDGTFKHQGVLYTADKFGFIIEYGTPFNDGIVRRHTIQNNNIAYVLYECDVTFEQAIALSQEMGGHLASLSNMSEYEIIQLLNFKADTDYWMGAHSSGGKWTWIDGTAFNTAIPMPSASADNALQLQTDAGRKVSLATASKTKVGGFICEIKLHDELYGDVDLDGEISSADARLILRHSVGLCNTCIACSDLGDIDLDGEIKSADARLLLRAAVSLEDTATWGKRTLDENNHIFK